MAIVACADHPSINETATISCESGTASGQGSSAQANAISAWIKAYQVSCPEATIEYSSVGSSSGVEAFIAGTGDFTGTDSPMSESAQAEAGARCSDGPAVHLPMVVGSVALVYNVAGVDALNLAPDTIAGIFSERITVWNDPEIEEDNPNVALPATAILPVHRSDKSGTTDNFTGFLEATSPTAWAHGRGGEWPVPGGTGRRGSNGIVDEVERSDGAIGYVEASYARFHNLPMADIGNAAEGFVALTDESVGLMIADASLAGGEGDLRLTIDHDTTTPGAYPLALITYEVVCQTGTPALVKSFLAYTSSAAGQAEAATIGYTPLPEAIRAEVAAAIADL
jgi:phosphate transport system substrate-binding protein